ncbi:MAG: flagellar biosynthetic protein FliO, partial [Treponema sp.]|nr:flagellar biosynthetic protein FliO [Treponema sp.]
KSTGGGGSDDDQFLRRVAHITVAPGKSVQVVTLVDRAFLIGVADDSINLIAELDDEEMINAMNLYADQHSATSRPRNFSEVLELFMPKKKNQRFSSDMRKSKNVFEDGASRQILDSLKKKSDRLGRED